jgi:hypothetical protein
MKRLFVDGFAWWPPQPGMPRPAPALLGPNERRRASDAVRVALEVAAAAVAQAEADAATLASVFTSAHGDLAIVDALCQTLAHDPMLLSPTRFHHSVHNAASGYWAIATGCRAPSNAVAAFDHSFAAGWLEAACECEADGRPVLRVGVDTEARGPLTSVNRSRGLLGAAVVLTPRAGPQSRWAVDADLLAGATPRPPASPPSTPSGQRPDLAANALADALPVIEALAGRAPAALTLPLGAALALALRFEPIVPAGA